MSLPAPHASSRRTRDLLAVLLILVGAVGVASAAFLFDVRAGIAVVSVFAIAAGIALGLDPAPATDHDDTVGIGGDLL